LRRVCAIRESLASILSESAAADESKDLLFFVSLARSAIFLSPAWEGWVGRCVCEPGGRHFGAGRKPMPPDGLDRFAPNPRPNGLG
jgi:hypothetical protein